MKTASPLSPGLCKSGIKRFWPLWLAGFVALLLLFVLPAYVNVPQIIRDSAGTPNERGALDGIWTFLRFEAWFYALVGSIIVAMVLNEHLFDNRAATFVGSLPLRRSTVFASSYVSGLLVLFVLPAMACACLVPLCLSLNNVFSLASLGEWLLVAMALSFVFYAFAQLSCQVSGTRLVALIVYLVIGFLALCIEAAVRLLMSAMVYGMDASELSSSWRAPAAQLLVIAAGWNGSSAPYLLQLMPYLAVACVVAAASAWLFGYRDLEEAGEGVLYAYLRELLKYLAGISLALLFGSIYRSLSIFDSSSGLPLESGEVVVLLILLVIGAFLGVMFADMIMSRSTHVLKTCWRNGLVTVCTMALFVGVCTFDLFGVGRYVPDPSEVEMVTLNFDYGSRSMELRSTEGVTATCNLQRSLIAYGGAGDRNASSCTISMNYRLKNGRVVSRVYPIVMEQPFDTLAGDTDGRLEPTDQSREMINELARIGDTEEGRRARYADVLDLGKSGSVQIEYLISDGSYAQINLTGDECADFIEQVLTPDLMEEPAGAYFGDMLTSSDDVVYDASVAVGKASDLLEYYGGYSMATQLSEKSTPHVIAWLHEHHPEVKLTVVDHDVKA